MIARLPVLNFEAGGRYLGGFRGVMGLGLLQHSPAVLQLQGKGFVEKPRNSGLSIGGFGLNPSSVASKSLRIEGGFDCGAVGFSQLNLGNVTRRSLLVKKGARSLGKLEQSSSPSGRDGGDMRECAAESCGESKSWRSKWRNRILGNPLLAVSSTSSLFWQPFWENGLNSGTNALEFGGGGDAGTGDGFGGKGYGNGGMGGGGSSGDDGSGKFNSPGHGTHVRSVHKKEFGDEEHGNKETPVRSPDFRAPVLASLSSAAGEAVDGEAPLADLLLGRIKRPGVAEETSASVLSKTPDKGSRGGYIGKENQRDALVEEVAAHAALLIQQKDGDAAFAKRSETDALKRLQREAFFELMKVRERLDKLEFHTGLRQSRSQSSSAEGASKTRLKGEVCAGGAFVLLDDQSSRYSRAAVEQAGLHTGMNVRFTFETAYREKDSMITECSAGYPGIDGSILGGPISVTKLAYNAQVTDDFNVVVAPVGARVSDITEIVNPLQDQALTRFARVGPDMYQQCVGSALGATFRGDSALVSLSQYLGGWGIGSSSSGGPVDNGPLHLSTLAHIMFQPWENSVFSVSAVNRFWPNPPLPSSRGLHWSEMGPLILSKTRRKQKSGSSSPQMSSPRDRGTSMDNMSFHDFRTSLDNPSGVSNYASWGSPYGEPEQNIVTVSGTRGSTMQSIALAGEIDVGANMNLAGWTQADRGYWLGDSERSGVEWGVSLTKTVGKTAGWGLCVGSSKVDLCGNEDDGLHGLGERRDMQLQMEAFMKLNMGDRKSVV